MFLHCFVRELRRRQKTHALQSQIPQVGLAILQELAELIARAYQQARLAIHVNDQVDRFEQHSVAGVGMLDLFGFQWFLSFVQNGVETFVQTAANRWIL